MSTESELIGNYFHKTIKECKVIETSIIHSCETKKSDTKIYVNYCLNTDIVCHINNELKFLNIVKMSYKNVNFTINLYTSNENKNYNNNIKLEILICMKNLLPYEYEINCDIDLFFTKFKKILPHKLKTIENKHIKSCYNKLTDKMYICI